MEKLSSEELNRVDVETFKKIKKNSVIVVLDNVRSLNNIGSVFRTCDAFAIEKMYLCGITATPPHKDIHKTALGATESVDWEYRGEIVDFLYELKAKGVKVVAVEQVRGSVMLNDFEVEKDAKYALVFGNEVDGVQQNVVDMCDFAVEIPQFGTKHSLNIAVSAGIVTWDIVCKMIKIKE